MLDLKTLQALNKFWQDKFDKRHPEAARRRDAKDLAAVKRQLQALLSKTLGTGGPKPKRPRPRYQAL